jgi:hypothetical protein
MVAVVGVLVQQELESEVAALEMWLARGAIGGAKILNWGFCLSRGGIG